MKNSVVALLVISCSFGAAQAAQPKWETPTCEYVDLAKDIRLSGRCNMKETQINGNFGYLLTWPSGNKVTVEYVHSQSGNHIWKINGKSAAAIEVDRTNLRGFTLDLNQMLEWRN